MFSAAKSFFSAWGLRIAAGLLVLLVIYHFRLVAAEERFTAESAAKQVAIDANAVNLVAIQALRDAAERDGQIILRQSANIAELARSSAERRATLDETIRNHPDVQAAVSAAYPLELVCVRDAANGVANADCPDQGE